MSKLICTAAVKSYIKEHKPVRVSGEYLDALDRHMAALIQKHIHLNGGKKTMRASSPADTCRGVVCACVWAGGRRV